MQIADKCFIFSSFIAIVLLVTAQVSGHELVDLQKVDPQIRVDAYASASYPRLGCFVVEEVACQLSKVQSCLQGEGYALKVYNGYRPYSQFDGATPEVLFEYGPVEITNFYNTVDTCGHSRGTAVDVTLVTCDGVALDMGGSYGIYTFSTPREGAPLSANAYHNRQKLQRVMERYGFIASPGEWWHFDYRSCYLYPLLNVPFEELSSSFCNF